MTPPAASALCAPRQPAPGGAPVTAPGGAPAGDPPLGFALPPELEAAEPPEERGGGRHDVRLLASWRRDGRIEHHRFADLPDLLAPGDLVVVNTSGTMAASVPARGWDGSALLVHLSTLLPGGLWSVELRLPQGPASLPFAGGSAGESLTLAGGGSVTLLARFPTPDSRLWVAEVLPPGGGDVARYLAAHGRPIRYGYVSREWGIERYQTVFATEPGSAEMPSAARAFTPELVTRLVSLGIGVAPLLLHTGVSSLEAGEAPYPERYRVPAATAAKVNATRREGGRVIAVGTTVVRALETVADAGGRAHPGEGWTDVVVTPARGLGVVDGLLTGWHAPEASHLLLLEAVAGRPLLEACYRAALEERYLWHEFGDLHLVLP